MRTKTVKLRYNLRITDDKLEEIIDSYKRDFDVNEVNIVNTKDNLIVFIEYCCKYDDIKSIERLGLSKRTLNCILRYNLLDTRLSSIDKFGELKHYFLTGELKYIRNLGMKSLREIAELLTNKSNKNDYVSLLDNIETIDYKRIANDKIERRNYCG